MAAHKVKSRLETLVVALPETAGSALYGLVDVLTSTGGIWQSLTRAEVGAMPFHVRIASTSTRAFRCGNAIPVCRLFRAMIDRVGSVSSRFQI